MLKSLIFLPIIMLLIVGCATTSSNPSFEHEPISSERILHLPTVSNPQNACLVHIMRDRVFKGSAMTTTFTINGKDIADIKNGEEFTFKLDPDEYIFGLKFFKNDPVMGMMSLGLARPKRWKEEAVQINKNEEYYFRIVDDANWE
jgi:hypothetical protein